MKKLGRVVSIGLCLMMLAVPAMAIGQNQTQSGCSEYGCNYAPYGYYNPSWGYNNTGFRGYDWSRYPGSTEYCSKWVPGHWVAVRVMMPGRWISRPVWIPGYPSTRYQWVQGFWQTTGYHTRPDVYVWGSQTSGWYGMPYQNYQSTGGGYFNETGVWIPQTNK